MRRPVAVLGVLAALGSAGGALASRQATQVSLAEKEFKITASTTSAKAGTITFTVRNAGHLDHEFIVDRTSVAASKLKQKGQFAVVTGSVGKIPPFKPGKTKTLTVKLAPGHYVLLCNVAAHYAAGQRLDFTVR